MLFRRKKKKEKEPTLVMGDVDFEGSDEKLYEIICKSCKTDLLVGKSLITKVKPCPYCGLPIDFLTEFKKSGKSL